MAADTAAALRQWLEHEYGGTVVDAEAPRSIGTGFSTLIDYVRFAGRDLPSEWTGPLVARTHKTVEEAAVARREAAIQDWCFEQAYPAPRVIAVFGPGELGDLPVQVMQRGPHADAVRRGEASSLASAEVGRPSRRAGDLRLHVLPIDGWPEPDGDGLADDVSDWFGAGWPRTRTPTCASRSRESSRCCPSSTRPLRSVCHGDFHPLNVLVDRDESMVIDWTDAALGDRHGDVARTHLLSLRRGAGDLKPCGEGVGWCIAGWLSKRFLNAYQRDVPLDAERLRKWEAVHLLHGWAQVVEAHDAGGALADRVPFELLAWIRERFEAALA